MDNSEIVLVLGDSGKTIKKALRKDSGSEISVLSVNKNVSCQTDFEPYTSVDIPIIFCSLFNPVCEAATLCSIPYKPIPSTNVECVGDAELQESIVLNSDPVKDPEPLKKAVICDPNEKEKHIEQTIEQVIHKAACEANDSSDEDFDSSKSIDDSPGAEDQHDTQINKEDSSCEKTIKKEHDDCEFSDYDDASFWKKIKEEIKKGRTGKKAKKRKLNFQDLGLSVGRPPLWKTELDMNNEASVFPMSSAKKTCDTGSRTPATMKAQIKKEVQDDGDWITDEEDDDDEGELDFSAAFKKEWKKKRHPYNTKVKNFVCDVCGKLYSKNHILREHIVRDHHDHEQAKRYQNFCQHCKRVYSGLKQLQSHQEQFAGPCEICGIVLKCSGLFWMHRRNHDTHCDRCDKVFFSRATYEMHMKTKHTEKTIRCLSCDKMFSFECQLKAHTARVHKSGQSEFRCDQCDFYSRKKSGLKSHKLQMHRDDNFYPCSMCKKCFSNAESLSRHMLIHNESQMNNDDVHSRNVSSISKGARDIKIRVLDKKGQPAIHVNSFSCETCNVVFQGVEDLQHHVLRAHGITNNPDTITRVVDQESIEMSETHELDAAVMQINVSNEGLQGYEVEEVREEEVLEFPTNGVSSNKSTTVSLPAYVVPPNASMVEIDGVQYHVIRSNQELV